jgi:hypothetical protein
MTRDRFNMASVILDILLEKMHIVKNSNLNFFNKGTVTSPFVQSTHICLKIIVFLASFPFHIECYGQVVSATSSCLGGPGFKSQPKEYYPD